MWDENEPSGARDRRNDRERDREPRAKRGRGDSPGGRGPKDRYGGRNRSRSPQERGSRRSEGNRYRERSPIKRDGRDRDGPRHDRERGDRNRDRDGNRGAPKGPREGGHRRDDRAGGPVRGPELPEVEAKKEDEIKDVPMDDRPEGMDDETWAIYKTMGFAGFKSTKNKKVAGNDKNFAVRRDKKMEARQYMNRPGGFNRPLSPSRM